ncbi:MAG: hypothetical protein KDD69_14345 [Bdellovibrionales bacterium]|nr:hypothetical protein [Bdellovibrionales bacterium]
MIALALLLPATFVFVYVILSRMMLDTSSAVLDWSAVGFGVAVGLLLLSRMPFSFGKKLAVGIVYIAVQGVLCVYVMLLAACVLFGKCL